MLCRVEMPMNEQIYARFYRYKLLHGIGTTGSSGRSSLLLMPLLLILVFFFSINLTQSLWVPLALVAIVAGYFIYMFFIKPNQLFRKQAGAALNTEVTIFTDNGFTRSVRNEEGGMPENTSGQYTLFVQAVETRSDFFLFYSPSQAYMIDKRYFTKGNSQELRTTLRQKLGIKFKSREKS